MNRRQIRLEDCPENIRKWAESFGCVAGGRGKVFKVETMEGELGRELDEIDSCENLTSRDRKAEHNRRKDKEKDLEELKISERQDTL